MPRQPHLREDSATKQAIGIPEGLQHFEMIVALAYDELDRLAGGFHRGVEVARLPLKFRRLVSPMSEYEGRVQLVDVTLRAERFDSRTGLRSYIPLLKVAPFRISSGRFSLRQSWVTTHPARWDPEECDVR